MIGNKSITVREQELGTNTKKVLKVFLQEEISALIDTCTVLVAIWTIEMALAWLRKGVLNLLLLDISLAVQWLRLHVPNAGAMDAIPGQGTKSPHGAANR